MDHITELFRVCGIAMLSTIALAVVGRLSGNAGISLRIGGGVLIFGILVLLIRENISALEDILSLWRYGEGGFIGEAFSLMLKALGVALLSKFCADVCRDCGEGTLAGGVESVGRVVMVSLCLPLLAKILDKAAQMLDMGF